MGSVALGRGVLGLVADPGRMMENENGNDVRAVILSSSVQDMMQKGAEMSNVSRATRPPVNWSILKI